MGVQGPRSKVCVCVCVCVRACVRACVRVCVCACSSWSGCLVYLLDGFESADKLASFLLPDSGMNELSYACTRQPKATFTRTTFSGNFSANMAFGGLCQHNLQAFGIVLTRKWLRGPTLIYSITKKIAHLHRYFCPWFQPNSCLCEHGLEITWLEWLLCIQCC